MKRRSLAAVALAWPLLRAAAQGKAVPRIAVLSTGAADSERSRAARESIANGLAQQGFVRGRDYEFDSRGADGDITRLPALARELVALKPALIVASGNQMLPIVAAADPHVVIAGVGALVRTGLAKSMQQPGGRATGVTTEGVALNVKRLELLALALPRGANVLLLGEPWARERIVPELVEQGRTHGLTVQAAYISKAEDAPAALASAQRSGAQGVVVLESPVLSQITPQIVGAAQALRLPAMVQWPDDVRGGALMVYGSRLSHVNEMLGGIIARILRGTPPGEIAVERVTRIQLAINLASARAIGFKFPPALLARADEVVE